MSVELKDLDQLLEVQKTDLLMLKLQKELRSLPQREKAVALDQKKRALLQKRDQVNALRDKTAKEAAKLENEDAQLAEKERHAQQLIEEAGSDYRSVEAHSKELNGFAKRRAALSEKLAKAATDASAIEDVAKQVETAIARIDAETEANAQSYKVEGGKIAAKINECEAFRARQMANVDADVAARYEDVARRSAGVAIGALEGNRCSVCRATIESGRLIALRAHAPLGECPSCKRMLVIR